MYSRVHQVMYYIRYRIPWRRHRHSSGKKYRKIHRKKAQEKITEEGWGVASASTFRSPDAAYHVLRKKNSNSSNPFPESKWHTLDFSIFFFYYYYCIMSKRLGCVGKQPWGAGVAVWLMIPYRTIRYRYLSLFFLALFPLFLFSSSSSFLSLSLSLPLFTLPTYPISTTKRWVLLPLLPLSLSLSLYDRSIL